MLKLTSGLNVDGGAGQEGWERPGLCPGPHPGSGGRHANVAPWPPSNCIIVTHVTLTTRQPGANMYVQLSFTILLTFQEKE